MQKIKHFKNKKQRDYDLPAITPEEEIILKKVRGDTIQSTVQNYAEILRGKHAKDLKKIYSAVNEMRDTFIYTCDWVEGAERAILVTYDEFKASDRDDLMLIQFIGEMREYLWGPLAEFLEDCYRIALSSALKVSSNPNFLARLYEIQYEE